eukprot:scaffold26278_cov19-Tisochrysis_lutea.AAC.1
MTHLSFKCNSTARRSAFSTHWQTHRHTYAHIHTHTHACAHVGAAAAAAAVAVGQPTQDQLLEQLGTLPELLDAAFSRQPEQGAIQPEQGMQARFCIEVFAQGLSSAFSQQLEQSAAHM